MRYRDFKIVESKRRLTENAGTTQIAANGKTYEVGNDLIKEGGIYKIFSGDSARQWAQANGYIVPPREVIVAVYQRAQPLLMPIRPNNPTDTNAQAHHQSIIELNGQPSGFVAGHKKEIVDGAGTRIFGGRWPEGYGRTAGSIIQNNPSSHGGGHIDYSQGMRTCKEVEGQEATAQGEVYVIGDSHARAMGGSNNSAVDGARLNAISSQAEQVPDGSTVWMTGGHNDVAAGASAESIANSVKRIVDGLKARNCTVNYVLFPTGTRNPNQENMAPTREAIKAAVEVAHDIEGTPMQSDGQHAELSSYRNIIQRPNGGRTSDASPETEQEAAVDGVQAGPPYPAEARQKVAQMQTKLQSIGYNVGETGIDGKYGPRTTRAVRAYKLDHNVDGEPNQMTDEQLTALQSAQQVANVTPTGNESSSPTGQATGGQPGSLEGTRVLAANPNESALPNQNIIDALDRACQDLNIQVQITPNGGRASRDGTNNHPPGDAADIQIVRDGEILRPDQGNTSDYDALIEKLVANAAERGVRPGIGGYPWGIHYDESGWRQGQGTIAGVWNRGFDIMTGVNAAQRGLA